MKSKKSIAQQLHYHFMKSPFPLLSYIHLLLCILGFSLSAHAQDATVNLRFVSFPKAANAKPIELFLGEGKTMEVEIPTNSISETYKVPALTTWSLGKTTTNPEGKTMFQVFGKTPTSGSAEQLILVMRKGPEDADGLELTAIKNSDDGFKGGKYIVMNAARVDIAGFIGTSKFTLKPYKFEIIAPQPTKIEENRMYCFAKFFFRKNEELEPFFSATWRFNEEARSMVFFYHDPNSKQLRLHTIRTYTP